MARVAVAKTNESDVDHRLLCTEVHVVQSDYLNNEDSDAYALPHGFEAGEGSARSDTPFEAAEQPRLSAFSAAAGILLFCAVFGLQWWYNKTIWPDPDVLASSFVLALTGFIAVHRFPEANIETARPLWLLDNARSIGFALTALAGVAFFPILDEVHSALARWLIHSLAVPCGLGLGWLAAHLLNKAQSEDADGAPHWKAFLIYFVAAVSFAFYSALSFSLLARNADPVASLVDPTKLVQILALAFAGYCFVRSGLPQLVAAHVTFDGTTKMRLTRTGQRFREIEIYEYGMKLLMDGSRPTLPLGIYLRGDIGRFSEELPENRSDHKNKLAVGNPVTFKDIKFRKLEPGVELIILQGGRPKGSMNRHLVTLKTKVAAPVHPLNVTLNLKLGKATNETLLEVTFHWGSGEIWTCWAALATTSSRTLIGALKIFFLRFLLKPSDSLLEEEHQEALTRAEQAKQVRVLRVSRRAGARQ